MNRIFWCLGASALLLSGCNSANQSVSEPAPQNITEAAPTSADANANAGAIAAATTGETRKPAKSEVAFDVKQFKVARTLELPYYKDTISGFAFSPDGKTIAGAGHGVALGEKNIAERGIVFLFDAANGKLLRRLAAPSQSESTAAYFDRVLWSPDGKFVVAWNPDHAPDNVISLCVWDVQSGKRTLWSSNLRWGVSAVAWARDGSLLVGRSQTINSTSTQGQLMVCDGQQGKIKSIFDLGDQVVSWIGVPQQGPPQLLVLKQIAGDGKTQSPLYQSSLRRWLGNAWSQPILQFKPNEIFWGGAIAQNGMIALSGVEQSNKTPIWGDTIRSVFLLGDLKTGKIVWRKNRAPMDMTMEMALSPDEEQIFARVMTVRPKLVFQVSNGAVSSVPNSKYPIFAPNGKRFLRITDLGNRGQKPHLKTAEIWER